MFHSFLPPNPKPLANVFFRSTPRSDSSEEKKGKLLHGIMLAVVVFNLLFASESRELSVQSLHSCWMAFQDNSCKM